MNIAVGKLGKKFYFNRNKWTIDSGDSEVSSLIITLAALNPSKKFFIIGTNDFSSLSKEIKEKYFPNNNVIDVWKDFDAKKHDRINYIIDYFNEKKVSIDFGYLHLGPVSQVNIPEKSYQLKSGEIAKVINMSKLYCGPMVHFLNESKIPYVVMGEDPRYFPIPARDLFHRPLAYLSTQNIEVKTKFAKEYLSKDLVSIKEQIINEEYDRWFLVSEDIEKVYDYKKYKKTNFLDIYTNGNGSAGEKKFKIIKEYMHKIPFYCLGKWSEELIEEQYKKYFFNLPMVDATDRLYRTKYTLMFHFEDGFPSSKFWKMINFGIIPFYHKSMDSQKNQPVHEYLRISSRKELVEKINFLESNPQFYNQILEFHSSQFKKEYFTGEFVNNIFLKYLSKVTKTNNKETNKNTFYKESVLFRKED